MKRITGDLDLSKGGFHLYHFLLIIHGVDAHTTSSSSSSFTLPLPAAMPSGGVV